MKVDVVKIVKVAGVALSVAGTIVSGWAEAKVNEKTLAKLVNKKFNK